MVVIHPIRPLSFSSMDKNKELTFSLLSCSDLVYDVNILMRNGEGSMTYNKYENLFRWTAHKLRLQDKFLKNNQQKLKCPRGAIYACYFGENIGYEKSRLEARPCVVISTNRINYNNSNIVVIPLTKEIKYKNNSSKELKYEWHYVLLKTKYNKLNYDSAIQCEDIRCVSKARLGKYICSIDQDDLNEIKKRLKKALQI